MLNAICTSCLLTPPLYSQSISHTCVMFGAVIQPTTSVNPIDYG